MVKREKKRRSKRPLSDRTILLIGMIIKDFVYRIWDSL